MLNVKSISNFIERNYMIIILVILFLIVVVSLSTKESFSNFDSWDTLAKYPETFTENLIKPFLKENSFINYYLPSEKTVRPMSVDTQYLELKDSETKVSLDVGNGVAVLANVKIPAQTAVVNSQTSTKLPEPVKTDTKVKQQVVSIPEQVGTVPGMINDEGDVVSVSVTVPEQQVIIPTQNAVVPVAESFKIY